MKAPTESYLKVHYELRPAKQVERRMLIDAFQLLTLEGFQITDYQYTGFGSIYFVDFILFHKLLGLRRLLSVEYSKKIKKRVEFNKPFDCVEVQIKPISDVIPTLSRDRKHILWLDYDSVLHHDQLADIILATSHLSAGSILLITVDVEPPGDESDGPKEWRDYFQDEAGHYLATRNVKDFAASKLPKVNVQIIERVIKAGLVGRIDIEFIPLFNFLYADGHQMLTMGGMLGTDTERRLIRRSRLKDDAEYIRLNFEDDPFKIRVPRLTRKERLYLDYSMPCSGSWKPKDFEMVAEDVSAYRQIYRFFPAYAELLL